MTPDEHYRIATSLALELGDKSIPDAVKLAERLGDNHYLPKRAWVTIEAATRVAQVHATLATIYRSTERLVEK